MPFVCDAIKELMASGAQSSVALGFLRLTFIGFVLVGKTAAIALKKHFVLKNFPGFAVTE